MPNQWNKSHEVGRSHYSADIGKLFQLVNSPDHGIQCQTLAMTNWQDIRDSDVVALLAPLSLHSSSEVRQLVALQLAAVAGSADDPRALQALVTLAVDSESEVRTAALQSECIAKELRLTPSDQSAKSFADRFVRWRQEGEMTTFSVRCPDISTAKQLVAIVTGFTARQQMAHQSSEKQTQPPPGRTGPLAEDPARLPDVIVDEETPEVVDLPRPGNPKEVLNVSKASQRLPQLLIDD